MTLRAEIQMRRGSFHLDAVLHAQGGRPLVVVGPNGAGKTTLLRCLAGLDRVVAGRIEIAGRVVDDGGRTWTPPHRRGLGYTSQDGHLFPHLSVLGNVAYGASREAAMEALAQMGISDLGGRGVHELSGGQSRLVAIARALARRPPVLLLDEPFAGLDVATRGSLRARLRRALAGDDVVTVLVAHEPVDALTLGETVAVLEAGRVTQQGTPDDLRASPATRYVAELVGVNVHRGELDGERLTIDGGGELVVVGRGAGRVVAVIHPRAVGQHRDQPSGSPRNVLRLRVGSLDDEGNRLRVRLSGEIPLVAEITPAAARDLGLHVGQELFASLKATEIALHPD